MPQRRREWHSLCRAESGNHRIATGADRQNPERDRRGSWSGTEGWVDYQEIGQAGWSETSRVETGRSGRETLESLVQASRTIWQWVRVELGLKCSQSRAESTGEWSWLDERGVSDWQIEAGRCRVVRQRWTVTLYESAGRINSAESPEALTMKFALSHTTPRAGVTNTVPAGTR